MNELAWKRFRASSFVVSQGNVAETHEHVRDFREFQVHAYSEDPTAFTNALQSTEGALIVSLD